MRICFIFLFFVLSLAACRPTPLPSDTGIEGIVTIGPMCPVVQADNPCPDKPYQATLTVLDTNGKKRMQFQTDQDGHFQVALAPGEYILHPESAGVPPFATDQPFVVNKHQFTHLEISYDSGIR